MHEQRIRLVQRAALVALAASSAVVGVWATFAPRSFYDDFPGLGRHWIAVDGPFNEHLVRDVGALNLALTMLLVVAAVLLTTTLVRTAALASIVGGAPHLLYHLLNLPDFSAGGKIALVGSLGLSLALPIVVLVVDRQRAALPAP